MRIVKPRQRTVGTHCLWAVWLSGMKQTSVETCCHSWRVIYETVNSGYGNKEDQLYNNFTLKSSWQFQVSNDRGRFGTSNIAVPMKFWSEKTLMKIVTNENLEESVKTNCHEVGSTNSISVIEGYRPSTRSCLRTKFKRIRKDHEPSRVRINKLVQLLRKRKIRKITKRVIKKLFPKSSKIRRIAKKYKDFYVTYFRRCDSFFSAYFIKMKRKFPAHLKECSSYPAKKTKQFFNARTNCKKFKNSECYNFVVTEVFSTIKARNCNKNATYNAAKQKIMVSADIELNPGPTPANLMHEEKTVSAFRILETKLFCYGLIPVEVGGQGHCFFHVISHQLFNDPTYHLYIRAAGVNYLRQNPERFIESNLNQSWLEYLENMSKAGTWADNIIIQAVADALNLKLIIVESDPNFAEFNIVEATNPQQQPVTLHIGHIGELHYVSTEKLAISNLHLHQISDCEESNRILSISDEIQEIGVCNTLVSRQNFNTEM